MSSPEEYLKKTDSYLEKKVQLYFYRKMAHRYYLKVLQKCIKAHMEFPYFEFTGWDVAIRKSDKPVLLEWNSKPLIWLAEALKGPFLKKELEEGELTDSA